MAIEEVVRQAVATSFPEAERAGVLAALAQYADREVTRVQLAILALAAGDAQRVGELVRAAATDYRDILSWAEWPERLGERSRTEMAERYRRLGVPVPTSLK